MVLRITSNPRSRNSNAATAAPEILPLPRPEAHLGLLARAEWHLAAGGHGARWLEVVRDGAALCAPRGGEAEATLSSERNSPPSPPRRSSYHAAASAASAAAASSTRTDRISHRVILCQYAAGPRRHQPSALFLFAAHRAVYLFRLPKPPARPRQEAHPGWLADHERRPHARRPEVQALGPGRVSSWLTTYRWPENRFI